MLKFSEKELVYLKNEIQKVIDTYNNGTLEELKELIHNVNGATIDLALYFSNNDYFLFNKANDDKFENKQLKEFCSEGLCMWCWIDGTFETAEEIYKYIPDETYCEICEKIINED